MTGPNTKGAASKVTLMVTMSEGLKEAIATYAQQHNVSAAEFVRATLAKQVKYPLKDEPKPARKTTYASPEERKAAQKARNKQQRALITRLLESQTDEARIAILRELEQLKGGK